MRVSTKEVLTRWMKPVAASQTPRKIVTSCMNLMLLLVRRTFMYCRMSGIAISLTARRNRRPAGHNKLIEK